MFSNYFFKRFINYRLFTYFHGYVNILQMSLKTARAYMFYNSLETRLYLIHSDDTVERVLMRKIVFKTKVEEKKSRHSLQIKC